MWPTLMLMHTQHSYSFFLEEKIQDIFSWNGVMFIETSNTKYLREQELVMYNQGCLVHFKYSRLESTGNEVY